MQHPRQSIPGQLALALLLTGGSAWAGSEPAQQQAWRYQVFLDEREIGTHRVQIGRQHDRLQVSTQADYSVRILRIPFYRYEHRSDEHWQAGCLQRLEARTDDNGEASQIAARLQGGALVLDTPEGRRSLEGCVRSFAYWQPELLASSERLLNTQTGEYQKVHWQPLGQRPLPFGDGSAACYRLGGDDLRIDLWYDPQGQWLALESTLPGGGTLRYRLHQGDRG